MSEEQDDSQKTEEPTQRRIDEAVKKGQVIFSREVTNFLMLLALALMIGTVAPYALQQATGMLAYYIESPHEIRVDEKNYAFLLFDMFKGGVMIILVPILGTLVAALLSSFMQNGFFITFEPVTPKLEKISLLKGVKRLFSMRSMMEFIKGVIKMAVVATVAVMAVWPELYKVEDLHTSSIASILLLLKQLALRMMIGICSVLAVIAVLDYLYQRFEYLKSLRMSKQDIKDEYKQSEGNPEIKAKLRQMRRERARKRMMAAVPTADVVITNPTHFAIALQYETGKHKAPVVVAKGMDNIALKIREIAKEHDVPIVENPPLARSLYDMAELDEQIPVEHFKAVAEIIAYVYKRKGKKAA